MIADLTVSKVTRVLNSVKNECIIFFKPTYMTTRSRARANIFIVAGIEFTCGIAF